MKDLQKAFLKTTGLTFSIEKKIQNAKTEEEKEKIFKKLSWQMHKGGLTQNNTSEFAQQYANTIIGLSNELNLSEETISNLKEIKEAKEILSVNSTEPDNNLTIFEVFEQGGEFTLTEDIKIDSPLVPGGDVVLNLNGFKIFNETDIWTNGDWALLSVRSTNTLTINGPGELIAKENDCYVADVKHENAKLIINDNVKCLGNVTSIYAYVGKVELNGGYYDLQQKSDLKNVTPNHTLVNCYDSSYKNNTASIEISGGEFVDFNPAMNTSEINTGSSFVKEGYKVQVNGEDNIDFYNEELGTGVIYKVVKK